MSRDTSIDFMKIVATILVMNSHLHVCYGEYSILASGGGIGDALFFLISGYSLFLSKKQLGFIDWYKRRVARILPTILAMGLLAVIVFNQDLSLYEVITAQRYWFVQCIFLYYLFIFPAIKSPSIITKYFLCFGCLSLLFLIVFCDFTGKGMIYGLGGYYRWILFFNFMLLGGVLARHSLGIKYHSYSIPLFIVCICLWYSCLYFMGNSNWQLLSLFPLVGICFFLCQIGKSIFIKRVFERKIIGTILSVIGSLCLESYLIQRYIITDVLNSLFPLNIPIVMSFVLLAAYVLHIVSSCISQVFDPYSFSWRRLFLGLK